MVELELSKEEAESLVRTLKWVMTACKMTEKDEEEMFAIIKKLQAEQPVSPGKVYRKQ